MKFVDEVLIEVTAGKGGDGCLSFRREKFVRRGGPDGGDGGRGGSIFLQAHSSMNTLIDFRFKRIFKAQDGRGGSGRNSSGKSGEDLIIFVPLGTLVYDANTNELIGDLAEDQQVLIVAQGGQRGLGNTHFKSSTNRAPRRIVKGTQGEERTLKLELKILADVGLLGMPNAGKSTLLRAISAAKPKVADYPFTTLYPYLGVVRVDKDRSFVVADIPGVIEGAAEGAGLGMQFLRHVLRCKLLLHLLDAAPLDNSDPVIICRKITKELKKFDPELLNKPRWIVLNKIDLLSQEQQAALLKDIKKRLKWKDRIFLISALSHQGTRELTDAIAKELVTY